MALENETYYDAKLEEWTRNPKAHKAGIEHALAHIDQEADLPGGEIDLQNNAGRQLRSLLEKIT